VQQGRLYSFEIPTYLRRTINLLPSVETSMLNSLRVCGSDAHTIHSTHIVALCLVPFTPHTSTVRVDLG